MFFENDQVIINILDVFKIDQTDVNRFNIGRTVNALSFRYDADTVFYTKDEEYHLCKNTVAFVPAKVEYTRIAVKDSLIAVHFDILNGQYGSIECFNTNDAEKLGELFKRLYYIWIKKESDYKYRSLAILYEILAECWVRNNNVYVNESKIHNSLEYIKSNYYKSDLSIKEIAGRSFMSEVYFRKLFLKEYGISPKEYIIYLRIHKAIDLMKTGYYTLKEIAFKVGYSDEKYFSTSFKKNMGMSPSEYIKDKSSLVKFTNNYKF